MLSANEDSWKTCFEWIVKRRVECVEKMKRENGGISERERAVDRVHLGEDQNKWWHA